MTATPDENAWLARPAHRRWALAGAVVLATALWMASGWLSGSGGTGDAAPVSSQRPPFEVAIAERRAESIERAVRAQGETRPHRSARLRAQTAGQVAAVPVESGQRVERGEILIELARGDRGARLKEARARVSQRQLELEAAQRLSASGYQARVQVEEARAALEQAQAALAQIRQDIDYTTIEAPWAGTIDEVLVDAGDYLGVNGEAVTLVDNDPLRVVAHFPQGAADALAPGQPAAVTLLSGAVRSGQVVGVAPRSDAATRTFRVEAEIPNPERRPAGTSAEMRIVTGRVRAHRLSPALLSLNTQGELGVKAVNDDNRIVFHAVEIMHTEPEGIWVTGLPDPVRLVVRGGGFVASGERVRTSVGTLDVDRVPDPAAAGAEG
ncbi:efflux RND transporter periplasmic adaptor subunit [Halofilum ochraceum]|uniref:efflux RND transporter periplasmic adaptor subunit n=1 Tax=Halofilum ochraceum TaxID=1611323 RepID=UPI0015861AB2|nr:efflux RND transporter periplasmic adaptor subunit [Halofilum ochraceum]